MENLCRILVIAFLLLWLVPDVQAHETDYRNVTITLEDGLSNSTISCILKDQYGFMWFGTWNGLNRYDGYEMRVYLPDPNDSTSIGNSIINCMYEDDEGLLWLGTEQGLYCYDQITGIFTRQICEFADSSIIAADKISCVTQDSEGIIWFSNAEIGLISYNKQTGDFNNYENSYSARSNRVNVIAEDTFDSNYLWIGTSDGLFRFNRSDGYFERIEKGIDNPSFAIIEMYQDKGGDLFMATWGNGLIKYNHSKNSLEACFTTGNYSTELKNSTLWAITKGPGNELIISVSGTGLYKYDMISGSTTPWSFGSGEDELVSRMVNQLYYDEAGIIWAGTVIDGLFKIIPNTNLFTNYSRDIFKTSGRSIGGIISVLEDKNGFVWFGSQFGGVFKYDKSSGKIKHYSHRSGTDNTLSSNNILCLFETYEDQKQIIWIGTEWGGLNRFEPSTGKFTVYRRDNKSLKGPSNNTIFSITAYDKDHLLLGIRGRNLGEGFDVFTIKTERFVHINHNADNPKSIGTDEIFNFYKDESGVIWIGSRNGGLNKFIVEDIDASDPDNIGYFEHYLNNIDNPGSIPNNTVYSIYEDDEYNLWIGTNGGGLTKFDRKSETFTHFPLMEKDNDNDNVIFAITGDKSGNLWMSSNKGILCYNIQDNTAKSFDKHDGVLDGVFFLGSTFTSSSGEVYFGGINGCTSFYPDSIVFNNQIPNVAITSLAVSGKKNQSENRVYKGVIPSESFKINTPYYQNSISFSFVALDYYASDKNKYKYMLKGFDNEWIEVDAERRYVSYTNLPPGKYVFTVMGSNNHNIWNTEGTSVEIVIKPPLWKTTVFRLLVVLVILCVIGCSARYYIRKFNLERVRVEKESKASILAERNRLRTLIDSMPDLIFIKDRESRFIAANKKTAVTLNTFTENLIGKTDFAFFEQEFAQILYDSEQDIMNTGIPRINYEEPGRDEKGNPIVMSTSKVPIKSKDGEVVGLVGICRDITPLKEIEQQLRKKSTDIEETNRLLKERQEEILLQSEVHAIQAQTLRLNNIELERLNRTKDKLFSIIAHDLRNPFNAIMGFSDMLRNDFQKMENAQKLHLIELINISSETAYNLLENLLQWARTQTNKVNFNPECFNLNSSIESVMNLNIASCRKKDIILKNEVSDDIMVYADLNMINTVLRNLVSNAIKFSKPNGEIVISAETNGENVKVHVKDCGVGMSREIVGHLFNTDSYYTTPGTMGESGTGLGLKICKEFMEMNYGGIKANSTEGKGTTLSIIMKAASA